MNQARPSTKRQRQLIAFGCARMGIDADLRHQMLQDRYGVSSSTRLTAAQASAFLDELRRMGFAAQPGKQGNARPRRARAGVTRSRDGGKVVRMVTQEELDKIAAVAALIEWRVDNGLALWMKKRLNVERVRTAHDAWLVIEGLKKMFENHMKRRHGPDWWRGHYSDPGIRTYIREHCPEEYR